MIKARCPGWEPCLKEPGNATRAESSLWGTCALLRFYQKAELSGAGERWV